MEARFPEGTFGRIASVLAEGEDRTDFVRAAVDNELDRRERKHERAKLETTSDKQKQPKSR